MAVFELRDVGRIIEFIFIFGRKNSNHRLSLVNLMKTVSGRKASGSPLSQSENMEALAVQTHAC